MYEFQLYDSMQQKALEECVCVCVSKHGCIYVHQLQLAKCIHTAHVTTAKHSKLHLDTRGRVPDESQPFPFSSSVSRIHPFFFH